MFSPIGLVLGAALAANVESSQKKTELELLGGLFGASPLGIVLLTTLAQGDKSSSGATTPAQPHESQVPDLTRSKAEDAHQALETVRLTAAAQPEFANSRQSVGKIIATKPPIGTLVPHGTVVTLVVSAGQVEPPGLSSATSSSTSASAAIAGTTSK